jgi:hypothetical protein
MTIDEARPLQSTGLSRHAEASAGWAITRALRRAAHMMTRSGRHARTSEVKARDLRRVLLIASPVDSGMVVAADTVSPCDLVAAAESLRAIGLQVEVYDAMTVPLGADSLRLHIEHSYPHVVAAAANGASSENARHVLRAAKELIPGVLTVLLGAQSASLAGETSKDTSVDYKIDDDSAETLPGLLARLREGTQSELRAEPQAA